MTKKDWAMRYSSEDLLHQHFERRFRGYDPHQVDELLQSLARDWDTMTQELARLQHEGAEREQENREFKRRERSLIDALETAKQVADDIAKQAHKRSASILEEAERRAEQLMLTAQREHQALQSELQELGRQRTRLKQELRSILAAHLRQLEDPEEVAQPPQAPAAAPEGPAIHRRPRTQSAQEPGAGPDQDDPSAHTLMGIAHPMEVEGAG